VEMWRFADAPRAASPVDEQPPDPQHVASAARSPRVGHNDCKAHLSKTVWRVLHTMQFISRFWLLHPAATPSGVAIIGSPAVILVCITVTFRMDSVVAAQVTEGARCRTDIYR